MLNRRLWFLYKAAMPHYRHVIQENWNDCGFACLAMLIDYFHHCQLSIDDLKSQWKKDKSIDLSFFDLQCLGEQYGLKGEGFQCQFEQLIKLDLKDPLLIRVANDMGLSHYVLLNHLSKDFAWIYDPSELKGETRINFLQLSQIYQGHFLAFKKYGNWRLAWPDKVLWQWTKKYFVDLAWIFICLCFQNLTGYFSAFFFKDFSRWLANQTINYEQLCYYFLLIVLWVISAKMEKKRWWRLSYLVQTDFRVLFQKEKTKNQQSFNIESYAREPVIFFENLRFFWHWSLLLINLLIYGPILSFKIMALHWWLLVSPLLIIIAMTFRYENQDRKRQKNEYQLKTQKSFYHKELFFFDVHYNDLVNRNLIKTEEEILAKCLAKTGNEEGKINLIKYSNLIIYQFGRRFLNIIIFLVIFLLIANYSLSNLDLIYLLSLINFWFDMIWNFSQATVDLKHRKVSFNTKLSGYPPIFCQNDVPYNVDKFSWKRIKLNLIEIPPFIGYEKAMVIADRHELNMFYDYLLKQGGLKLYINNQEVKNSQWININYDSNLLPGLVYHNIFWNNQDSSQNQKLMNELNKWLVKYQLTLTTPANDLNQKQKQLVNFLFCCCHQSPLYLLNDSLSALSIDDQLDLYEWLANLWPKAIIIIGLTNVGLGPFGTVRDRWEHMI